MRLVEKNKVDNDIINNLLDEAFNPENEEKNKIIRQALRGPKNFEKQRKALKDIGIKADRREEFGYEPGETIYLRGKNGRQLSVDPDGTNVWNTLGDGEKHYKKELNFRNRHSKNYNNQEHLDFNGERAKSFDYYNYLNKPENEYQNEVDKANKVKKYSDNKDKAGYNLPDEALSPEEKSLNKRPRRYIQLKKDREELEKELSGYDETKKKLDKTNNEIKKLHEDYDDYEEDENEGLNHPTKFDKRIIKLAKTVAKKLGVRNVDYSFDYSYDIEDEVLTIYFNDTEVFGFFDDRIFDDFRDEIDIAKKSDAQIEKLMTRAVINNLKELNESAKLTEDSYDEIENKIKEKCNLVKELLSHYGDGTADVSYSGDYNQDKLLYYVWVRSGKFKAEDISYYENDIDFEGRLYLDENLNFVKTDIKCASGPNLMNKEFITALNALYTFVESNGDSYEG